MADKNWELEVNYNGIKSRIAGDSKMIFSFCQKVNGSLVEILEIECINEPAGDILTTKLKIKGAKDAMNGLQIIDVQDGVDILSRR